MGRTGIVAVGRFARVIVFRRMGTFIVRRRVCRYTVTIFVGRYGRCLVLMVVWDRVVRRGQRNSPSTSGRSENGYAIPDVNAKRSQGAVSIRPKSGRQYACHVTSIRTLLRQVSNCDSLRSLRPLRLKFYRKDRQEPQFSLCQDTTLLPANRQCKNTRRYERDQVYAVALPLPCRTTKLFPVVSLFPDTSHAPDQYSPSEDQHFAK